MARGIDLPTKLQGTNPTCRLKIIIIINLLQRKPKEWGHPKQDHYRNCSLCGYSNHRATDYRTIRHDAGNIKQIIPTRGTRNACPNHIKTHLHHPPSPLLCLFRSPHGILNNMKQRLTSRIAATRSHQIRK